MHYCIVYHEEKILKLKYLELYLLISQEKRIDLTSLNSLAWGSMFKPVVPSNTRRISYMCDENNVKKMR